MNRTSLKICGIQKRETLQAILHLPIDYIGFVLARSKRQVTAEHIAHILRDVKEHVNNPPLMTGVFVNPTTEELHQTLRVAPLDVVQLHGQESAELCRWVKETFDVQVFKVISVSEHSSHLDLEHQLNDYVGHIDTLMLDTFDPTYGGGSGKTFAWERIPPFQQWCRQHELPLFVAGGLNADNVNELIDTYQPDGVDVSSGVETDGEKDIDKITRFVERVKHR